MRGSGTWKRVANAQWLGNLLTTIAVVGIFSLRADFGGLRSAYDDQTALMLGRSEERMLSTTWTSGGQSYTVETPCRPEQEPAECWTVHDARVAVGQELHPPDPPA
jgi:hypothetical protein